MSEAPPRVGLGATRDEEGLRGGSAQFAQAVFRTPTILTVSSAIPHIRRALLTRSRCRIPYVLLRGSLRAFLSACLLDLGHEELIEQVLALVQQHVGARPAQTTAIHRGLSEVYLSFQVLNDGDASVVKLHPFALAFNYRVVVSELEALALVHHDALQVVHFRLVDALQA